jgi:hypothetical protein
MSMRAHVLQGHLLTPMEDKAIHSNLFVAGDAHSLYQLLLVAYRRERGHEPAVPVVALAHIVCGRTSDIELRLYEDILPSLSAMHMQTKKIDVSTSTLLTDIGWKSACSLSNPVKQSAGVSGRACDLLKSASISKCGSRYF